MCFVIKYPALGRFASELKRRTPFAYIVAITDVTHSGSSAIRFTASKTMDPLSSALKIISSFVKSVVKSIFVFSKIYDCISSIIFPLCHSKGISVTIHNIPCFPVQLRLSANQ